MAEVPVKEAPLLRTQGGSQWVGDLLACQCAPGLLLDANELRALCLRAVADSGLTPVGESFHQFEPGGATGVVVLAESHLAVHTWPEIGFVTIDLYVCNVLSDNSAKADGLFGTLVSAFAPRQARHQRVERGA